MNKTLIFLIISIALLVLSAIVICIAPLDNNLELNNFRLYNWGKSNCAMYADYLDWDYLSLDSIQRTRKSKNMCYRKKAMYGLEHSAFIINAILSFVCAYLTLLHYLNVGKDFEKKTGLIGLISGAIGFVLTFLYVCYSGYIFNNDPSPIEKLYPNGALYKWVGTKYIKVYANEKGDDVQYVKYKDLGKNIYNYDSKKYEVYHKNAAPISPGISGCNIIYSFDPSTATIRYTSSTGEDCDYLFPEPTSSVENKYIYDRWLTSLILAVIIFICDIALAIFGLLLFLQKGEQTPSSEQLPVIYKK